MRWRATTARQQRSAPFWQLEMSAAQWFLTAGEERRLPSEADQKLVMAAALFLGRQMEE